MGMIIAIDAGHYNNTPGKRCMKAIDPNETRERFLNARHVVNSEGIYELQYNGATVNGSDQIISGATYTLFNING